MADKEATLDALDHPLPFAIGMSLFVAGFLGFLLWGAKNLNQTGLARLIQLN